MHKQTALLALTLSACAPALQQPANDVPPPVAREFRGVWVASVSNIDWPSKPGLPVAEQKRELIEIFDKVRQMKMNAVVLQVRPAADALYASALEPWSEYLTGKMGEAPSPFYDPLEFAVTEAHKRGLELHAWFNPYRARHPSARSAIAPTHLSKTRPDLVHVYGKHLWMDPGEPDVRKQTVAVILDVVKRYDVDGIHLDDYFYPYQERDSANTIIPFPDDASFNKYLRQGGKLARDDWRRANVDQLIDELYRGIKQTKQWVKFGISPFGIWRPGHPPQIKGFDAYANLYANSKKWLNNGWLDYWTPQLYWPLGPPDQSYSALLAWWAGENTRHRHVWPGNAPYRVASRQQNWPASEIVDQIAATRAQAGATGNIHFSMRTFMRNQAGIADTITARAYTYYALPPRSSWLDDQAPPPPRAVLDTSSNVLKLQPGAGEQPMWYSVRMRINGLWYADVIPAADTSYPLLRASGILPAIVSVTAVDRSGNESTPVTVRVRD